MLDADVDALLNVAVPDDLVDNDADGVRGDVVHDASAAVIEFVGHAFLLGSIGLDVNDVPDAEVHEERRNLNRAMVCNEVQFSDFVRTTSKSNIPLKPRLNMWRVRAL